MRAGKEIGIRSKRVGLFRSSSKNAEGNAEETKSLVDKIGPSEKGERGKKDSVAKECVQKKRHPSCRRGGARKAKIKKKKKEGGGAGSISVI